MKKQLKKLVLTLFIVLEIFALSVQPTYAFLGDMLGGITGGVGDVMGGVLGGVGLGTPSASSMLEEVEERYHLSPESMRDLGETFNTSSEKTKAPEVDLFFSPNSPEQGKEVTATALPMYFSETGDSFYYTWYLKHDNPNEPNDGNTDHNEDGEIDIEDYKIEAMRLIASNGFFEDRSESDTDNDGWSADDFGGRDGDFGGSRRNNKCFVHDFESGINYQIIEDDAYDNEDEDDAEEVSFNCGPDPDTGEARFPLCVKPYTLTCPFVETGTTIEESTETTGEGDSTIITETDATIDVTVDLVWDPTANGGLGDWVYVGDSYTTDYDTTIDGTIDQDSTSETTGENSTEGTNSSSFLAYTDSGFSPFCTAGRDISCPSGTEARCTALSELTPTCDETNLLTSPDSTGTIWDERDSNSSSSSYPNLACGTNVSSGSHICDIPSVSGLSITAGMYGEEALLFSQSMPTAVQIWIFYYENGSWHGVRGDWSSPDWKLKRDIYVCEPNLPAHWARCPNGCALPPEGEDIYITLLDATDLSTRTDFARYTWDDFAPDCNGGTPGTTLNSCSTNTLSANDASEYSGCDHLFPNAPGEETGDGSFGYGEENFWHTNPRDPSTASNQNLDEANVAGLGIDKFSWLYQNGDTVGVAVEGVSMTPTKQDDSSLMIMWALTSNVFDGEDGCEIDHEEWVERTIYDENDPSIGGVPGILDPGTSTIIEETEKLYSEEIEGYNVTIPLATTDINGCLIYNMVDPMEGGQSENLNTTIDYQPSHLATGETATLRATIDNPNLNTNQIYYEWEFFELDTFNIDSSSWTNSINDIEIDGIQRGLGLSSLTLTVPDVGDNYLGIRVKTEEFYSSGLTRGGLGDVILDISSTGTGDLISFPSGTLTCNNGECESFPGNIVTASLEGGFDNYAWTLNGEPLNDADAKATGEQDNTVVFPIVGNAGDIYVLGVIANSTTIYNDGGEQASDTVIIRVVDPTLSIGPSSCGDDGSGLMAMELDSYDLAGMTFARCSTSVFTSTGASFTVNSNFPDTQDVFWTVNGTTRETPSSSLTIDPVAEGFAAGTVLNISASLMYAPEETIATDLTSNYNVPIFNSSLAGKLLSDSIQVRIGNESMSTIDNTKRIMASLFTNLPGQLLFMFRILLTVALIIFSSGLVMAVVPRVSREV